MRVEVFDYSSMAPSFCLAGFVTYGSAWVEDKGISPTPEAKQIVEKGWHAIEATIELNGRVNWVQHVGKSPDPVKKTDFQLFGARAVCFRFSEMVRWK